MVATKIGWYSLNDKLKTEEHAPIPLEDAHAVVRRYHGRGETKYDSGEAAISATMFGFARGEADFVEFCVNGFDSISFKFEWQNPEITGFKKLFRRGFHQVEQELTSLDEMLGRTTEYFELGPAALLEKLEGK